MKRIVMLVSVLVAAAGLSTRAVVAADTITVFAAASLREAFEAAAPAFTKKTGIAVSFDFGGSDTLATQLLQAAPASVFASANEAQMKKVAEAGLLAAPAKTFARNRLVIITPKANVRDVNALADLARTGVAVVLAAPTVPVGAYARAAFARMSGRQGYAADFAAAVEKDVVSNELDVKAVAIKVALGEADAGIVYATDVTPSIVAKLHVIRLPAEATTDATYPIAALTSAPDGAAARAFVDFMAGDGQRFLKERGFLTP